MSFDDLRELGKTKDFNTRILAKIDRKRDELERKAMNVMMKAGIAKK